MADTTTIGRPGEQGILTVPAALHDTPGLLCLESVAGGGGTTPTLYYLWVDSSGKLRVHNAIPTDQDADGTVVGAQTA